MDNENGLFGMRFEELRRRLSHGAREAIFIHSLTLKMVRGRRMFLIAALESSRECNPESIWKSAFPGRPFIKRQYDKLACHARAVILKAGLNHDLLPDERQTLTIEASNHYFECNYTKCLSLFASIMRPNLDERKLEICCYHAITDWANISDVDFFDRKVAAFKQFARRHLSIEDLEWIRDVERGFVSLEFTHKHLRIYPSIVKRWVAPTWAKDSTQELDWHSMPIQKAIKMYGLVSESERQRCEPAIIDRCRDECGVFIAPFYNSKNLAVWISATTGTCGKLSLLAFNFLASLIPKFQGIEDEKGHILPDHHNKEGDQEIYEARKRLKDAAEYQDQRYKTGIGQFGGGLYPTSKT